MKGHQGNSSGIGLAERNLAIEFDVVDGRFTNWISELPKRRAAFEVPYGGQDAYKVKISKIIGREPDLIDNIDYLISSGMMSMKNLYIETGYYRQGSVLCQNHIKINPLKGFSFVEVKEEKALILHGYR